MSPPRLSSRLSSRSPLALHSPSSRSPLALHSLSSRPPLSSPLPLSPHSLALAFVFCLVCVLRGLKESHRRALRPRFDSDGAAGSGDQAAPEACMARPRAGRGGRRRARPQMAWGRKTHLSQSVSPPPSSLLYLSSLLSPLASDGVGTEDAPQEVGRALQVVQVAVHIYIYISHRYIQLVQVTARVYMGVCGGVGRVAREGALSAVVQAPETSPSPFPYVGRCWHMYGCICR